MNPQLPEEASDFGAAADKAFAAHGAVDLARTAEADPSVRGSNVAALLRSLGADDLDPRYDLDTAAAAGALCRAAGRVTLPYPLVAALLRDPEGIPTAVVGESALRHAADAALMVDHADLFDTWRIVTMDSTTGIAVNDGNRLGSRLGPFVGRLEVRDTTNSGPGQNSADAAMATALTAWKILGCVERALELAVTHVREREQFGQKLADFQAVQFQLADAAVAVAGLDELCRYTTWKAWADPDSFNTDALALRLYALETARSVLRTSQQLHGAAGVCDEYDVSVLARHIQPDLRLPFGAASTASQLVAAVDERGFDALFPQGGSRK